MKDRLLKAQQRETDARIALDGLLDAETLDTTAIDAAKKELQDARSALSAAIELEKDKPILESRQDTPEGRELRSSSSKPASARFWAPTLELRRSTA